MRDKKIKAVLFDVDGIIIDGEEGLFSERYSRDYNVPMELVSEFFVGSFRETTFGKADLKEEITPYLIKWDWKGSADDFLKYWFERESKTNPKVLKIVKELRAKGIKCYLATRQEKYRASYFMNTLKLKDYFDGIFCTCDIGYDKNQSEFWDIVIEKLKEIKPREILFFDDSQKNIDSANTYGLDAYFYSGIDVIENNVKSLY